MFEAVETVEVSFTTSISAPEARRKTVAVLNERAGRIKVDEDNLVIARFGSSWKTRLFGTVLAGVQNMPREVKVEFQQGEYQTSVSGSVRDTFGFGSRLGVAGKLRQLMQEDAIAVKQALDARV
jgi:hypothetical protein